MTAVDKTQLLKILRTIAGFDPLASPFVAMQLPTETSPPRFYRSGSSGLIMSKNMLVDDKCVYVSVDHFIESLGAIPEDTAEILVDPNGTVLVKGTDQTYCTKLHVHTVKVEQAALKSHDFGKTTNKIEPAAFKNFSCRPFQCTHAPILNKSKLMVSTTWGIVMWQGPDTLAGIKFNPRETFLRFVSGGNVEEIFLTSTGYWGAETPDLVNFIAGHNIGGHLFHIYDVPGVKLTEFPAARLVQALEMAASQVDDNQYVEINPEIGVTVTDNFGNEAEWGLGKSTGWNAFKIFGKTAKTVANAFSQTNDEIAVLYRVDNLPNPTYRLTRGPWEVNVKIF